MTNPQQPPSEINYQGAMMVDRDAEHLRILSLCWYIASGLALLGSCVPLFYMGMGLMFVFSPRSMGGGGPPPPPAIAWAFFVMGTIFSVFLWVVVILGFITAGSLPKRRRLVICYIAAGLACLQIPVGTTLGVFTLVVLSRRQVRESFS